MPALPDPRPGNPLQVKGRLLPFSIWPVGRGIRRYGLSDFLFAKTPWAVLKGAIEARISGTRRTEALAFLEQSRSFFEASGERSVAAAPLLLYYAFLNLAKVFVLSSGHNESLDRAMHGLKDSRRAGADEISQAEVTVKTSGTDPNIFALYAEHLGYDVPANNSAFSVEELMAQVVVGHRLWREAGKKERFLALSDITFFHDVTQGPGNAWLQLRISRGDLKRYGITQTRLVDESRLAGTFRRIRHQSSETLCYEQVTPVSYGHRAADVLLQVVDAVDPLLWRSATSMPPYRHYYVHLTPTAQDQERLPQLLSLYMLFFYFGSVTRYRPHIFEEILSSDYGPFVNEFMASQADQLLYLLATEICEREVVKPALI